MAVQKTFFLVIHLKLIYSPHNSNFLSTENFEDHYIIDIFNDQNTLKVLT